MEDANRQNLTEKKNTLEEQVRRNPWTHPYWVQLGNVSKQLGDTARATEAYQKALDLNPNDSYTKSLLDELESRSFQLPVRQQTPPEPAKIALKYGGPTAILLIVIIVVGAYLFIGSLMEPDPRIIMATSNNTSNPHFSPDGKWVAFILKPPHGSMHVTTAFYVATPDGKTFKLMLDESEGLYIMSSDVVWLPDSSGFVVQMIKEEENPGYYIIEVETKNITRIPLDIPVLFSSPPAISSDGREIAFVSMSMEEGYMNAIFIAEVGSGVTRKIGDFTRVSHIAWSPDDDVIAFCASYYDEEQSKTIYQVMAIELDSGDVFEIDEADYNCEAVFFGAENPRLVYEKNDMLFSVPLATLSDPEELLPSDFKGRVEGGVTVSADMRVLAYNTLVGKVDPLGGGYTVTDAFLLVEGETEPIRAKNMHDNKLNPSLSPDGKWMAYVNLARDMYIPFKVWVGSTPLK